MAKKENTTKSFVLRVDAATMEAIEKWAADEFRSTNGQLQWIINEALRKSGRLKNVSILRNTHCMPYGLIVILPRITIKPNSNEQN